MKGVVFTEFLDFVAHKFGNDIVDDIVNESNLPSGGAYTSVGTYDHREMQTLVAKLAEHTSHKVPDLLISFGQHLSGVFAQSYPDFFSRAPDLFDFLESVQRHIHVEVRKLYPDAELPTFDTHMREPKRLELDYRSCRPLADLAQGLILGVARHFGDHVEVAQKPGNDNIGNFVRISIRRVG